MILINDRHERRMQILNAKMNDKLKTINGESVLIHKPWTRKFAWVPTFVSDGERDVPCFLDAYYVREYMPLSELNRGPGFKFFAILQEDNIIREKITPEYYLLHKLADKDA